MNAPKRTIFVAGLASVFSSVALQVDAAPPSPASAVKPVSAVVPASETAKDPLEGLLSEVRNGHARLRDYTCTFTRQVRINGVLSEEQVSEMRVRLKPLSVAIRTAKPVSLSGQELIYVEGSRLDGKMKIRPASSSSYLTVSVDDPKALAISHKPVTQLPMAGIIEVLSEVIRRERAMNNPIEVYTSDYQFANRPVRRYEIFTRRPHAYRMFYRAVVYVDKETQLPVRYEAYDQPRSNGSSQGELIEVLSYSDIRTNVGLGDTAFAR